MGRSENNQSPCELIPATIILSDFENEEDNIFTENDGYQLLADNEIQEPFDNEAALNFETDTTQNDDDHTNSFNEIPKSEKSNDTPRDIVVDFEQVRAVMSRVTLPTSAIPAWAAEVPDAELDSFLRNRITSLQQRTNSSCSNES